MKMAEGSHRSIRDWFKSIIEEADFCVTDILLTSSKEWKYTEGAIKHKSKRFFNVVGIEWKHRDAVVHHPMIEQREIGDLGFLKRISDTGVEILMYAKIEPGNCGIVQLAPTCQATASNASRIHGGEYPPFSELFKGDHLNVVHESLQSEQGTKFLGKLNRNILAQTSEEVSIGDTHRWLAVDYALSLLHTDYIINTDARSVLVCSPWNDLVDRPLFSKHKSEFARQLFTSNCKEIDSDKISNVIESLNRSRSQIKSPEIIDLDCLKGWKLSSSGVIPDQNHYFTIRQIKVSVKGREVPEWDQPIIDSFTEGYVDLLCGYKNGILYFLLTQQVEAGLHNKVELGPTYIYEPGSLVGSEPSSGTVVAEVRQSDEGGRFFRDITHYRIIDIGEAFEAPADQYWFSLSEIQEMLKRGNMITNEGRSVLSLLLYWL